MPEDKTNNGQAAGEAAQQAAAADAKAQAAAAIGKQKELEAKIADLESKVDKTPIDPERLAAQVKTFREQPHIYAAVKQAMGEEEKNSEVASVRQELKEVKAQLAAGEIEKFKLGLLNEFGLQQDDMDLLTGDTPEQIRKKAEKVANLRKAAQQLEPGGTSARRTPALAAGAFSGRKTLSVKDALDNVYKAAEQQQRG